MRVNLWQDNIAFTIFYLGPCVLYAGIYKGCIAALCRIFLTSKNEDLVLIGDGCVIFEFDGLLCDRMGVVELNPAVLIWARLILVNINFMEVTHNALVDIVPTMNVHKTATYDCSMVWAIGDVLAANFDLCPPGVECVVQVSLDSQGLSLGVVLGLVYARAVCCIGEFHLSRELIIE